MKSYIYIVILLIICNNPELLSQKHFNNWYFGNHAGITFNTKSGDPETLLDGELKTDEGCSTISDSMGNLLFYTDGITVWNRHHKKMINGDDLFGHVSSSQSAIIVPKPATNNIYYIFTVYAEYFNGNMRADSKGFNYSIIDLSLGNGLGAVTEKNTHLLDSSSERLTAILHENGKNIWVVSQDIKEKCFAVYLLTENGLNKTPVKSNCSIDFKQSQLGIMKFSSDGKKLAFTDSYGTDIYIYDFNNTTGEITNEIKFPVSNGEPYGIEFSDNNEYIYVTSNVSFSYHYLTQYNITNFETSKIKSSEKIIFALTSGHNFWALQMGPNKKIYMTRDNEYLSVINQPNQVGGSCNFILDELDLGGNYAVLGLPSVVQNSKPQIYISDLNICEGDTLFLAAPKFASVTYEWSGPLGFSSAEYNPVILNSKIENSGIYSYKINRNGNQILNGAINVNIIPRAKILFSGINELNLCQDSLELTAVSNPEKMKFKWKGIESNENTVVIKSKGLYSVYVENEFGCIDSATINININKPPRLIINSDNGSILCSGTKLHLSANSEYLTYKWSTGETAKEIAITKEGYYSLIITDNNGCSDSTGIYINAVGKNIIVSDKEHNFGNIKAGNLSSYKFNIENNENTDITVQNIFIKNNPIHFNLIHPVLPFVLKSKEKIEITVNFIPKYDFELIDSIIIISDPCNLVNNIKISGKVEGKIWVDFWLPDTTAEIGDVNYKMPFYIQLKEQTNTEFITNIKAKISFLRTLYKSDDLMPGDFSKQILKDTVSFNIEFKDVKISGSLNNISNFAGDILLAQESITKFKIENFEFSNPYLIPILKDGSIKTKPVCIPNLKGIKMREGTFLSIKYDKNNTSKVIAYCGNEGNYSISIFTVAGDLIYNFNWNEVYKSEKYFELSDILQTNGLYFIVLKYKDIIDIQKISIIN